MHRLLISIISLIVLAAHFAPFAYADLDCEGIKGGLANDQQDRLECKQKGKTSVR